MMIHHPYFDHHCPSREDRAKVVLCCVHELDITVLFVGTTNFCIRFISYVLLPDAADIKGIQRGIKTFG